jgi:hypothetical protein
VEVAPLRWILAALLLLPAVTLALPAAARDPFAPGGGQRGGIHRPATASSPYHAANPRAESLRRFNARRGAEAGARLLEQRRDLERRAAEPRLRRSGTVSQVRAYRARAEARERADDLRIRQRLSDVDRAWWDGLGPDTRRVLERSDLRVRRAERLQELRRDLDTLEREAERREGPSRGTFADVEAKR